MICIRTFSGSKQMFIGINQNIIMFKNLPRPIKKNKNLLPRECIQLILTSFHFPLSKDTFKKFMANYSTKKTL